MARPTPRTCFQVRPFSARNPTTPWTHPLTTASVPACAFVELWRSFIETIDPSDHTPPVFEVVAPLSEPMNTSLDEVIWGCVESEHPAVQLQVHTGPNGASRETVCLRGG